MNIFTLTNKIKLWKELHPNDDNICETCPFYEVDFDLCQDMIKIFQDRYKITKTTTIYKLCPIPFMDREDFE